MKRKSTFIFEKKSGGIFPARRRWELKSIRWNQTRQDALAVQFWGMSYTGIIRVTKGGMTLVRGRKKRYLDWDEVAETLQNFNARP